jgi:signal transduction histidine kinase
MGEPKRVPAGVRELRLVERRERSLLSLFELSHELGVGLDPYGIAQLTLFSLMGHFGAGVAALWMPPGDSPDEAVLMRSFGLSDDEARASGAKLGARAALRLAQGLGPEPLEGADPPTVEEGALRSGRGSGAPEIVAKAGPGFSVLIPISAQGRLVAFAALGPRLGGEPYRPLDFEYLAAAAGMVGVALENTRLYHRMLESNRRLRDSNARLAELDRLKSEFLQGVNHELRTPLTIIVGFLDALRQSSALDETGRRAVSVSIEQAEKLGGMLENLLDFSDLEEDALRLEIQWHDPAPLLSAFAAARRPGVVNGLRELEVEIEDGLPLVRCDARRLAQVLDAILDNAVKFTPAGARIALRAARRHQDGADWVALEVEDDGPGIAADQLAALFEPFRQGDGSTTRAVGGLGLGLALAREIATRMGARMIAESQTGAGSTFGLMLPTQ